MSKLILHTTAGDVHEITFKLNKKVVELIQYIMEKFKFSPKLRLIFNNNCLNNEPEKEYAPIFSEFLD